MKATYGESLTRIIHPVIMIFLGFIQVQVRACLENSLFPEEPARAWDVVRRAVRLQKYYL